MRPGFKGVCERCRRVRAQYFERRGHYYCLACIDQPEEPPFPCMASMLFGWCIAFAVSVLVAAIVLYLKG